ncbi:hypothetical protein DYB25_004126 [Aphanomyces astaci]|uniref:SCP domain-containing protein n=4 Tax=Aphanomyces astaci TaxID=112090 RepID=A0A397F1R0_APHAT|nr:hypothetical protein DYB25_004126 [Aphanomyces astaci]RHY72195.1 hypothetical protein DYB34_006496 [Aphanomyces astaci]RHZ11399.1 hypothetical protein DYB31_004721 [Aphanomyces astaci]RHZ38945.1 hypothetical protein DYB26_005782 [Aphanomyces astaci]
MTSTTFLSAYAVGLAAFANYAQAHGRLIAPPHRGYIGKLAQFAGIVPPDYDDHSLNAGGIAATSGGKFGVCGDSYSGTRQHETGGTYGTFPTNSAKAIGACYAPGSTVDLQVQLMANYKGYFEFGLCKLDTKDDKESNECFQTLAQPNGETKWQVPPGNEVFTIQSVLPAGVTCEGDAHCVLRWHYVEWNNTDVGIDGQEQYWNCADVYISNTCGTAPAPCSVDPTYAPAPSPSKLTGAPVPSSSKPSSTSIPPISTRPQPTSQGSCGTCNNCYYPGTNACFIGWSAAQCAQVAEYKWCGPAPSSATVCGTCTNCYYPGSNACFIGWSAAQCAQNPAFNWCGANAVLPSTSTPTTSPSTKPVTQTPSYKPIPIHCPSAKPTTSPIAAPTTTSATPAPPLTYGPVPTTTTSTPTAAPIAAPTTAPKTSAATPASSTTTSANAVRDQLISQHNKIRAAHGVGPVTWDDALASIVQVWASKCPGFVHGEPTGGGQNLATNTPCGSNTTLACDKVLGASWLWYDKEETLWNYGKNKCNGAWIKCGHFSNMMSPEVKSIGCGWSFCHNGNYVWCNYNNPGKNPKVPPLRGLTKPQLKASLTV